MELKEKIEQIILEQEIKVSDFLTETGISKTAYYAIKNGKTKKLSYESAKSIVSKYPSYSYKWLMADGYIDNPEESKPTSFYKKDGSILSFRELCQYIADDFDNIVTSPELEKPIKYFKLQIINTELIEILKESQK